MSADRATKAAERVVDALRAVPQGLRARVLAMAGARFGLGTGTGGRGRPRFATDQVVAFIREEGGAITVARLSERARISPKAAGARLRRAIEDGVVLQDGERFLDNGGAR